MRSRVTMEFTRGERLTVSVGGRIAAAIARGLNRTAVSERAWLARAIAAAGGLKVSDVKKEIFHNKASSWNLVTSLSVKARGIPLISYKAKGPFPSRGRGTGVTATVFGERRVYPNAFIAIVRGPLPNGVMSSGHKGVFERKSTKRLPIRQRYGPPLTAVFAREVKISEARRAETLKKNVEHEIAYASSQLGLL